MNEIWYDAVDKAWEHSGLTFGCILYLISHSLVTVMESSSVSGCQERSRQQHETVEFAEHRGILLALILGTRMRKKVVDIMSSLDGMGLSTYVASRTHPKVRAKKVQLFRYIIFTRGPLILYPVISALFPSLPGSLPASPGPCAFSFPSSSPPSSQPYKPSSRAWSLLLWTCC